jgi:endoglycosylceramidase
VLGYELLNEPWPGTLWQLCANPVGCPLFDAALARFNARVTAAIRAVDPKTLIWVEPNVLFNQGVNTTLPALGDPHAGFAFHDYCLPAGFTGTYDPGCDATDQIVFANAVSHAQGTGEALLMTEFGATDRREDLNGVLDKADRSMVPWIEWHYCGCKDPTTAGPGDKQAVVIDPAKAPEGDNIKRSTLELLARPHPAVVAGTPVGWSWDAAARRLEVSWSTQRAGAGAGAFGDEDVSEISVTPRAMADGYATVVDGGAVVSAPGARVVQVAACPGARRVSVTVTPGGSARGSCDPATVGPRLSVSVRPRTLRARRATRLRITVRAKGRALRGARVRAAGARATTNSRGAATLRVRVARAGRAQLVVSASGHRLTRVALRVRR